MGDKPILTFITSGINRLVDDAEHYVVINGLVSAFSLRLTFTSINEAAQNSGGERVAQSLCPSHSDSIMASAP